MGKKKITLFQFNCICVQSLSIVFICSKTKQNKANKQRTGFALAKTTCFSLNSLGSGNKIQALQSLSPHENGMQTASYSIQRKY